MTALSVEDAKKLGTMIRELRQAAGLTRQELEAQTRVAAATIRNCETCRHRFTAWTLRQLLAHPSMHALPAMAAAEGIMLTPDGEAVKQTSE